MTMSNRYTYQGPLNGGYAIQDQGITWELRDFCESTYEWREFFAADGVTDHSEKFIERFSRWIRKSKLNNIKGMDAFPHVTQTNGTSEAFQMFIQRHSNTRTFKFFKGDFMMHKVASNNAKVGWSWIYNYSEIQEGDALIISCPFSDTGSEHNDMKQILDWCTANEVPVLIDMAYFGMCYNINVNLDKPCVEEVTFSLEAWGPDYIPNKYMKAQMIVCNQLEIKPTKCVIFGLSNHEEHYKFNRGNDLTRLCLSKLLVEEYERT